MNNSNAILRHVLNIYNSYGEQGLRDLQQTVEQAMIGLKMKQADEKPLKQTRNKLTSK